LGSIYQRARAHACRTAGNFKLDNPAFNTEMDSDTAIHPGAVALDSGVALMRMSRAGGARSRILRAECHSPFASDQQEDFP
jgi:hypothetical protein